MARRGPFALLLVALALVGAPEPARADAVPPPPASCPPQTHPVTGYHGTPGTPGTPGTSGTSGTGCAPDHCPVGSEGGVCSGGRPCCLMPLCDGRAACPMGQTCAEVRICAVPGKTMTAGRSFREATGYCGEMTGCPAGSTCEIVSTCMTASGASATTPGRRRAACSCNLAGAAPSGPPLAAQALALAALLGRRRARKNQC